MTDDSAIEGTTQPKVDAEDEPKLGPVARSYLVRVTLHDGTSADPHGSATLPTIAAWRDASGFGGDPIPTNDRIEKIVGDALYVELAYFTKAQISVRSELTDR